MAETRIVASIVRARDSRGQDLRSPLAGRVAHVAAAGGVVTTARRSRRVIARPWPGPGLAFPLSPDYIVVTPSERRSPWRSPPRRRPEPPGPGGSGQRTARLPPPRG